MKKLSVASAIAVTLSSIAAAPAVAQETVAVHYGDLDLNTVAGAQVLDQRLEAGVKAVCDRPDIRDLKSMLAYEQCKDAAMTSANAQLARQGAPAIAAN
jgi:UrcA family protein